ncbi:uncharacterized protein [Dendrobates tinctorius]
MESILKDEEGAKQEADGSERSVTSTCRITNEADRFGLSYETVMEADSDLLENLQPPTLEVLTNETINAVAQASVSPHHKETSQRSLDTSLSNDNPQGICDATLLGELESSPVVVESSTEEIHADTEMRHLKEESETSFKELEAFSDGTDEWETASEESVALDRVLFDPHELRDDTGSSGHKIYNEELGLHGQETVIKDPGIHGHQRMSEDTGPQVQEKYNEEVGLHGHETFSEGSEPYVYKTISEQDKPHAHETVNKEAGRPHGHETVNEDIELHNPDTVNEDRELHSQERVKEDADPHIHVTVGEAAGPCGLETVHEETKPHFHQTVGEHTWPHGHATFNKDIETNFQETDSKEAGPQCHETISEEVEPHGQETLREEVEPHGQETLREEVEPHGQETLREEVEPHGQETLREEVEPHGQETLREEVEPHGQETLREEVEPHGQETLREEVEPHGQETLREEVEPHGQETLREEVEPHGQETLREEVEPHGQETLREEVEPHGQETLREEVEPHGQETLREEVEPHGQETLREEVEPHGQETLREEVEPHGQETLREEVEPHGQETLREEVEPHGQETLREEVEPHGQETLREEVEPHGQETLREEVEPHGQETLREEVEPHGQETLREEVEPHGQETLREEVEPHGQETLREEVEPHGQETLREEVEPHGQETLREEVEPHGQETLREEVEPHGQETLREEVEPHGQETLREEVEPHGQETLREEVEPHGQETLREEVEPHGQETLREEAEPQHMETDTREASFYSQNTYDGDTGSCALETVSEEAEPHGQLMSNEEQTGLIVHESVGHLIMHPNEETVGELVRPLGNETDSELTRPYDHNADPEVWDNEAVSGRESAEFDDCRIDLNKDNISAVPDQALDDSMVTENQSTSDDRKETVTTESPDENEISSVEKLRSITDDTESEGVNIETFSYGSNSDQERATHEAQEVYIETINEEVSYGCKKAKPKETQEVYEGTESQDMQGIYKETFRKNTSQETPDSEDTNVLDKTSEISESMKEVASQERIVIEPSSEEREMADKEDQLTSNADCECTDELSETSRILEKSVTNEHELHDEISMQRWDLAETFSKHGLSEDIEITYLERTRLEEKLLDIENLVETDEGLSKHLPNVLNQETLLELQYITPVFHNEKSYIGSMMNTETQLNVGGSPQMEEKKQVEYAELSQNMETQFVDPENIRPTDTQNELDYNQRLVYKAEPMVQAGSSYGQGIGEPCLPLSELLVEQSTDSKGDSNTSFQDVRLGSPEPHQEETMQMLDSHTSPYLSRVGQSSQKILQDELDNYKLNFFPVSLKGIAIVPRNVDELDLKSKSHDILLNTLDTECIAAQETTNLAPEVSGRESEHHKTTLDYIHSATGLDQDTTTLSSEIGKTTDIDLENIKLLRRQRSNTDPYLNRDQEEKLQSVSKSEGSSRGRLRSVTPPCDKFTSYTPTSTKTLEQTPTSVLYPMPDEMKASHRAEDTTSTKEHTFYPTQIFNPMLLLGHIQESGFYQEKNIRQSKRENQSHDQEDNPVFLHINQPETIVGEPKMSSEEASNTKTMLPPSVGPVWLPPHPTRYVGGVNDTGSLKTQDSHLIRRATIRHKRSNVGVKPTNKRFSNPNLPAIPQRDDRMGPKTSNLPKIQPMNISTIQISSRNRQLAQQQRISAETGQSRGSSSMATVREEGQHTTRELSSNNPDSVHLRGSRNNLTPPSSESSASIHRRYSTFINSSSLLYQEYSDVALNQEIQRQKPGDSPAEDSLPSSPRVRRRILSSQESYLQRLSISSADSLWQDIPKIRDSVTFLSMTREEQKLQEAKFELIMSEALYLRSLHIAVDHFQLNTELQELMSAQDRQWLFSRLSDVRDASNDFLFDLEEEFESNMYNFQVCDVVIAHEPNFRRVYLPYVTNQSYQDRTFQRLMTDTPRFQQVLAKLESDPVCQRLSLKSFLILPFQRITRLRLLLQNILKRSAPGSTEELQATQAHNLLGKLIRDCNESVQRMKDTEELILLNQKIQFECKIFPLISQSRRLVKHGEVTSLEYNSKWKVSTRPVYLHLFNDCLLLSRVREGGRFVVFDHASEFRVERCEIKLHTNQKNIFRIFLRDSAAMGRDSFHDLRETEFIFRTETQSQKLRWICALSPPKEEIDFLRDHGLSQMQCLKSYKSRENDELSLEKADILMITQNSDDGWLRGIRLSDQQSGWFPQANVQPISRNACIRNLEEEKRLQTARAKLQPTGATKGH